MRQPNFLPSLATVRSFSEQLSGRWTQNGLASYLKLAADLGPYVFGTRGGFFLLFVALFRTLRGRSGQLNEKRLHRTECLAMIKCRCRQAGMENASLLCNHTFRSTGITAYLRNDNSKLEHALQIAGHSDPKTTLLYDRWSDEILLDEVEKIGI